MATNMAPASKGGRQHALAVPLPFQGHIHPMMELSKKLVSAGFMVTFANTQANHEVITGFSKERSNAARKGGAGRGDEENGEGGGGDLHLVSLEEGLSAQFESPFALLQDVFKPEMKAAVARLLARLCEKGTPVSLLAFDFRLPFVQDLAAEEGIPSLSLWTQNAANFVCNLHVAQGHLRIPPDDSKTSRHVRGVPPFKCSEISGIQAGSVLPSPFANEYAWGPFKRVYEPTWIALNTFDELEVDTMETLQNSLGFRPLVLGPLVNAPSFSIVKGIEKIDIVQSHLEWLQGHTNGSILYVAFGTIVTLSEEQLEELILGLEASQQSIFWVFRPNLCGNSKKYTLDALSRRFKRQGLVVDWASQWHVLSHPAVGGFITHCGWNSILEGIHAGVPMLGWPMFADQALNQRCLEEQWGIGLGFKVDDSNDKIVSRIEIQNKVRELMQGEKAIEIRDSARTLSNKAKRCMEEGGPCYRDLMILIQAMRE